LTSRTGRSPHSRKIYQRNGLWLRPPWRLLHGLLVRRCKETLKTRRARREVFADFHKPRFARHRLIPQHVARHRAGVADLPLVAWSQRPDTLPTQMSPQASAEFGNQLRCVYRKPAFLVPVVLHHLMWRRTAVGDQALCRAAECAGVTFGPSPEAAFTSTLAIAKSRALAAVR
jgi:hypothetical protein